MRSVSELARDAFVNAWGASAFTPRHVRWILLRLYGVRLARASVGANCWFGSSDVTIGPSAYVNRGVFFDGTSSIDVGRRVHLGMEVMILTGSHTIGDAACRAGDLTSAPVVVGDGAWIGARAVLMPGTVIGAGTVVAAGSVVHGVCDPNSVYAGVPARKIRELSPAPEPATT